MFLRRLPTIALLAGLPILLANCGSDSPSGGGGAGAPPASAGSSGASAGQPAAGAPAGGGGSTSVGGGGSTSVGGGGSTSVGWRRREQRRHGWRARAVAAPVPQGKAGGGSGGSTGSTFTLTSPDHAEGAKFAKDYTCDAMNGTFGAGVNPSWIGPQARVAPCPMRSRSSTRRSGMTNQWGSIGRLGTSLQP